MHGRKITTEVMRSDVDRLRNAHAMEQQAEQILKASRIEHYPELETRITQHIQKAQGQQQLLESCFERLGETLRRERTWGGRLHSVRPLAAQSPRMRWSRTQWG